MAQDQSTIIETKLYISRANETLELTKAIADCRAAFHGAVALLYAPHQCFLATVDSNGKFQDSKGEIDTSAVFEARVFNDDTEFRWLNKINGEGQAVVLCEDSTKRFFQVEPESFKPMGNEIASKFEHSYLLWGESVGASDSNGWAQFAEARIKPFSVPISRITANKQRAQFIAVEYLGEYEDGNVAVVEERLMRIEVAPNEQEAQNNNG